MTSALAEAEDIRQRWPDAIVYFAHEQPWAGAEFVGGTPMTSHESASQALQNWLSEHGRVFGISELDSVITEVTEWGDSRTFMRFSQKIDGMDVPESHGRALAHKNGDGTWSITYVRCAALDAPKDGLPIKQVGAEQARAIASTQSESGKSGRITRWGEPVLTLAATPDGLNPREARQVWDIHGFDPQWRHAPVGVRIDAVTGRIVAEWEMVAGFADDVSGSVEGLVLSGEIPYETLLPCVDFDIQTDTATVGIPRMLVELANEPSGPTVASTYTDANGVYGFMGVTIGPGSTVRFRPVQEFFQLGFIDAFGDVQPIAAGEVGVPSGGIVPAYTYVDHRPNPPMTDEYRIADMTAWTTVASARAFYKINNQTIPGIDDDELWLIPNTLLFDPFPIIGGIYLPPTGSLGVPAIITNQERPVLPNWSMPTILSHEYGHFALDRAFGIQLGYDRQAFHEGYADVLSILHNQTDVLGYATSGCLLGEPVHGRDYTAPRWAWEPQDKCDQDGRERAKRLVHAWRGIRDSLGNSAASELFVNWSFLATPEPAPRLCFTLSLGGPDDDLSARDATFFEVLIADDDDGALNNGTPNAAAICAAFEFVGLPEFTSFGPCPDSARGGGCPADFDGDGAFTVFDLLVLQDWIMENDPRADINRDGRVDVFDMLDAIGRGAGCL